MLNAAHSGNGICHINLARGFRGGERQTEILIRELAARLTGMPGLGVLPVRGRCEAITVCAGATLIHAHETRGAQVARIRQTLSGTPYVITRRVDNSPRGDPFTRSMYVRAAQVAVLSEAIGDILANYDARISVRRIPSSASDLAVDAEWVQRFRHENAGKFIVGTVGALDHSHKGQLILLEAARLVAQAQPDIQFVIVGNGRDEQELKQVAADLPNVTFAGWSDNVGDYLAAFDLFAFPSLHEGLGSVLIDALQFGLPIVASAVGGIVDLVADQENGILVAPGDAGGTASAIVKLYATPALREAMAAANRKRGLDYRPSLMAERYRELYEEVLNGKGRS
jgi:glycosyltransferase involved in cell wall biosynthesis